jgi:hypothetical protein
VGTNSPENAFRREENLVIQIITAHAFLVRDRINLAEHLDELTAFLIIIRRVHDDTALGFLSHFKLRKLFLGINGFRYKSACI